MLIGCLSWGSLVWNPGDLPVRGGWQLDGPLLPIEFARLSQHERITLVILNDPEYAASRSLWTLLDVNSLPEAVTRLRQREGCPANKIGQWTRGQDEPEETIDKRIHRWAQRLDIDALVWTKLGPKWDGEDRMPSDEEVQNRLEEWGEPQGTYARLYFQMAPRQIDTPYRRTIVQHFGWPILSPY